MAYRGAVHMCSPTTGRGSRIRIFERSLNARQSARASRRDVTPHTLRYTAITRMLAAGIDHCTVMETVGHLTRDMLQRYTHPTTERKRTALETVDRVLVRAAHRRIGTAASRRNSRKF